MKLSTLVNYQNELAKIDLDPMLKIVEEELQKILYLADNRPIEIGILPQQLHQNKQHIKKSISQFSDTAKALFNQLTEIIKEVEQPYFADSYKLYENEIGDETLDDIKNRVPNISTSTLEFYRSRLVRYTGWQHPALILRPGVECYINDMVSCDPVYLVDTKHELLQPCIDQFNEVYQKRLRPYVVDENSVSPMLTRLPDRQFGLVFAYNYFNFRPFEIIKKWLAELLEKLKPGGMLLITFNDCDRDKAVMLVEQKYCCYTPGAMVKQLAQTLGYEVVWEWHDGGPSTWIELKKPGQLTTLRGGQTLAKIIPK